MKFLSFILIFLAFAGIFCGLESYAASPLPTPHATFATENAQPQAPKTGKKPLEQKIRAFVEGKLLRYDESNSLVLAFCLTGGLAILLRVLHWTMKISILGTISTLLLVAAAVFFAIWFIQKAQDF